MTTWDLPGCRKATNCQHRGHGPALFILGLLVSLGCQGKTYRAASLPAEYAVSPTTDVGSLDLSHLTSGTYSSRNVQPGDRLAVTVVTGAEKTAPEPWTVTVQDDGQTNLPLIGPLPLAGLDLTAAQGVIRDASIQRGIFRQPTVSVALQQRDSHTVTVVGAVETPGSYRLPRGGCDLLAAIVAAGGLTEHADSRVEIRRHANSVAPAVGETHIAQASYVPQANGPQRIELDLVALANEPAAAPIQLSDGDLVRVLRREPRFIHVIGLVNGPNRFEIPPGRDLRVLDAIAMAGGLQLSIADKVTVQRKAPNQSQPILISMSLRKAKNGPEGNLLLADGDVVTVEETPSTFVVGALKQMVRVGVNGAFSTF